MGGPPYHREGTGGYRIRIVGFYERKVNFAHSRDLRRGATLLIACGAERVLQPRETTSAANSRDVKDIRMYGRARNNNEPCEIRVEITAIAKYPLTTLSSISR